MTQPDAAAPLRIAIHGNAPAPGWLDATAGSAPGAATFALFGACADADSSDYRIARFRDSTAADATAVLREAVARYPSDDLIVLRTNTVLPPYWSERLVRALAIEGVLAASPLDNVDAVRAPLPAGARSTVSPQSVDALCWLHGRHQLIDTSSVSTLLSAWSGARLRAVSGERLRTAPSSAPGAEVRTVVLDHLYVADPQRSLQGPSLPVPGSDALPPSALGELRERVAAALRAHADDTAAGAARGYPGLDRKPVVLHVLHGWGGGAERFVRDLARGDDERHHLVLTATGAFSRRCYGEALQLRDGRFDETPLRQQVLADPICTTVLQHRGYREFLATVVSEFGVDAIMVSSLIGHSLDALRSGLPTLIVGHDYYPLWPLLHRDFGDPRLAFDAAQLQSELDRAGAGFEFAERDPRFWTTLRDAYLAAVIAANATLVAPSRTMHENLLRLERRLSAQARTTIAHGLAEWPVPPVRLPAPPARDRLRLVMIGRVRAGKGAELLRAALPAIREHADVFLLGAGAEGEQFFGSGGVHVLLNYQRDDLPALLSQLAPDAALLLPTVAETFSYALSELHSLGLPVIATRLGALAERIRDRHDGWLVAPDADDIVATIARLQRDRAEIAAVRAAVAAKPKRSLAAMAADYRALLPLAEHPLARHRIGEADNDRVLAQARAGEIGAARRMIDELRADTQARQRELDERAEWAMSLERELDGAKSVIAARDATIAAHDAIVAERDARLADLDLQLIVRTQWAQAEIQRLNDELDERTAWAKSLDAQIELMRRSASWRLTRPLRYAMRQLRALRVRVAFSLQRLRSIARRTRGSVASRGVGGTMRRIGDEFRRGTVLAAPPVVSAPDADFAAFALPVSATPRVTIVIPVHNKIDYTIACLRSIGEHAGSDPFDVVVVDDASSDDTRERLTQAGGVAVVHNEQNLGFIGSCNAGAARATGEFVVFLNNDTVVTPGWLDSLLRVFDDDPRAGLVGAKLVYPDGRLQEAGGIVFNDGSGWNYGRFDDPADPRYNFRRAADYCSGAALAIRRALFQQLGGFDTRYAPAYYEDTDLAFGVRAAGFEVLYEPRSTVIHFEGITSGTDTSSGIKRFQVVNQKHFVEKWKDALASQPAPIHDARRAAAAAAHGARGRILIVDAYTPTPDQDSGSLRMLNVMRLLRELGYAVAFLPENRAHAGAYTQALQALGVEALYHPFVSDPVAWLREHGRTLSAIVLSRHYIAVHYVGPARLYAPQARLIFDTVDLHYLREERAAALSGNAELARLAAKTKAQELKVMRETDVTLVVSAAEQQLLARELPQRRIEVLSNVHVVYGCRKPFAERRDLVFIGGFQHPPNTDAVCWFAAQVMPLLRRSAQPQHLHVIGSKAPPEVLAIAADDISVHGYVPDIAPFLDQALLSIAPLRYGAGVKGKINMAMSYGLPVVATSVAVEGMHVRPGEDVLVADTPDEFVAAITRAGADAALWQTLSENGLGNVREYFSFDAARAALLKLFPERR